MCFVVFNGCLCIMRFSSSTLWSSFIFYFFLFSVILSLFFNRRWYLIVWLLISSDSFSCITRFFFKKKSKIRCCGKANYSSDGLPSNARVTGSFYPQRVIPLAKGRITICCMPPVVVLIYQLNLEVMTLKRDLTCGSFFLISPVSSQFDLHARTS